MNTPASSAATASSVRAAAADPPAIAATAAGERRSRAMLLMVLVAVAGLVLGLSIGRVVFGAPSGRPVPAVHPAQPARQDGMHASLTAVTRPASYSGSWAGNAALSWAETQRGAPYSWGAAGPYWSGYDCSGLVYRAFARLGIWLPRTTYGMLGSPRLHRTWTPHRGDLAFYGSGHVEFVTVWYHTTFGAHSWGDPVGWAHYDPAWGWAPTAFYSVY